MAKVKKIRLVRYEEDKEGVRGQRGHGSYEARYALYALLAPALIATTSIVGSFCKSQSVCRLTLPGENLALHPGQIFEGEAFFPRVRFNESDYNDFSSLFFLFCFVNARAIVHSSGCCIFFPQSLVIAGNFEYCDVMTRERVLGSRRFQGASVMVV